MKPSKKQLLIGAVIIVAAAAWGGYRLWRATPEYAFLQIKQAVDTNDKELFAEYVDLESVLSRGVDAVIASLDDDEEQGDNLFGGVARGFMNLLKPRLVDMARAQIEQALESRPGQSGKGHKGLTVAAVVDKVRDSGRIAWRKSKGKLTTVGVAFTHAKYGSTHELHLLMREKDGHLQLIEIANLVAFTEQMEQAERAWKQKQNQDVNETLERALQLEGVQARKHTGKYGHDKKLSLGFKLRVGKQPLTSASGSLVFSNAKGEVAFKIPLRINDAMEKGARSSFAWRKDLNPFVEEEMRMWKADYESLTASLRLTSVTTGSGQSIALPYPDVAE